MNFKKFAELCEMELDDFLSEMFTGTEYAINAKNDDDYEKAKAICLDVYGEDGTYIERIFATMLERGMPIVVTDPEGKDHDFNMEVLEKAPDAYKDYIDGNHDMCTGMNLIDCCIFGDVVYG